MGVVEETEILSDIRVLLEKGVDADVSVFEFPDDDPLFGDDSPVLVIQYKGERYLIAVESLDIDKEGTVSST